MKILTSITVSQAVEATRNIPSPEKTDNLCFHISICSLKEGEKHEKEKWPFESRGTQCTACTSNLKGLSRRDDQHGLHSKLQAGRVTEQRDPIS